MVVLRNIEYITDARGHKKSVLLRVSDFQRMQEELEDLEDALALEKARKNATGFKKWNEFLKELQPAGIA